MKSVYLVTVSFQVPVAAEDSNEACEVAEEYAREEFDAFTADYDAELLSSDSCPSNWKDTIPWGDTSNDTIGDRLSKEISANAQQALEREMIKMNTSKMSETEIDCLDETSPVVVETRVDKFKRIVDSTKGEKSHIAIIVAQIDPDAVGSAFGMQELLRMLGSSSCIYYSGKVSHPQNEALFNKYNLLEKMRPISDLFCGGVITIPETYEVLVDSNKSKDGRIPGIVNPIIIVDHHRGSDVEETSRNFIWLDEDGVGSASTLISELLREIADETWADGSWVPSSELAVLLGLGVYTDTKCMTKAGCRDDRAFAWCKQYAQESDLSRLIHYKRPFTFLKNMSRAVQYIERYNTYRQGQILAGLGRIQEKQGDDLASVADALIQTIGAPFVGTWAFIESSATKESEQTLKIRFCARSEELGINLGDELYRMFGKNSGAKILPDGSGEGGALFEFPVGPWLKGEEMEEIINKRLIEMFFNNEDSPKVDAL